MGRAHLRQLGLGCSGSGKRRFTPRVSGLLERAHVRMQLILVALQALHLCLLGSIQGIHLLQLRLEGVQALGVL